jgi:hypothetical protein
MSVGDHMTHLGDEEAIGYFKEAIRIRPRFAAAQKNLEIAISMSEKGP